jgi:hypothetical protein
MWALLGVLGLVVGYGVGYYRGHDRTKTEELAELTRLEGKQRDNAEWEHHKAEQALVKAEKEKRKEEMVAATREALQHISMRELVDWAFAEVYLPCTDEDDFQEKQEQIRQSLTGEAMPMPVLEKRDLAVHARQIREENDAKQKKQKHRDPISALLEAPYGN